MKESRRSVAFGWGRLVYRWLGQIMDPLRFVRGCVGLPWYLRDWRAYRRLPGAERLRFRHSYPQLHDRTTVTPFDAHYFYINSWAMRRIVDHHPNLHVDVGSQWLFAALLSSVVPVLFLDYRPLEAKMKGLTCAGGNILELPLASNAVQSLSCLHVAEHIGLGRYGDPLDPKGTERSARELARVLAPGGRLYFGLPVGKPALHFNAHRIHAPQAIRDYFSPLELVEFCLVTDAGTFSERVPLSDGDGSEYACGMFLFEKAGGPVKEAGKPARTVLN